MRHPRRFLSIGFMALIVLAPCTGRAQTFSSGSTGADGAFTPGVNTVLQIPPNGEFHFTTVNIPAGVSVSFTPNATNSPVTILASGDVTIAGTLNVNGGDGASSTAGGLGGAAGPGGFRGGNGTMIVNLSGGDGLGPGGGEGVVAKETSTSSLLFGEGGSYGSGAKAYGSPEILPLIGGSGGGAVGGGTSTSNKGAAGGGGGGAILIASSGTITVPAGGIISARGGRGGDTGGNTHGGGGGSGGSIRLMANSIQVGATTGAALRATGGGAGGSCCTTGTNSGNPGRIRLEAFSITVDPTLGSNPAPTTGQPSGIRLSSAPALTITSIAGVSAPSAPTGAGGGLDMTFPNPGGSVDIEVAASGIQPGTVIDISIKPELGDPVDVQTGPLAGSLASSTATASATLPEGVSFVTASVTLTLPGSASLGVPFLIGGEPVEKVRLASVYGGSGSVTYITKSGREYHGGQ